MAKLRWEISCNLCQKQAFNPPNIRKSSYNGELKKEKA